LNIDPPAAELLKIYGFIPYLQNNWTLHVSKERTIRTQMNTDEHGLKRKFVSPSARKDT
jgi:hypothetical protein